VLHDSEVTLLIWLLFLFVVSRLASSPFNSGALALIRATTHTHGATHRSTFKNSRSTRRERRIQQFQSVSHIL
jgi:hypothetical protein